MESNISRFYTLYCIASTVNSTWNINVHWYDSVTTSDDSVGVVVVASSVGATGGGKL